MPSVEEQSELPGAGDMRPIRLRKLEATQRLLGDTIAIDERSWQEPCHLPGWTRAHVATHLARNADAFTRVAAGMMTGINTPLYISERERFNDIERGSERRALDLQVDLDTSAGRLYHENRRAGRYRRLPTRGDLAGPQAAHRPPAAGQAA